MALHDIADALRRAESVLGKRPSAGRHADSEVLTVWEGGLRTRTRHDSGAEVVTDLSPEVGGAGGHASPGWLLRAALASCAVSRIAMAAAAEGIALNVLEARVTSSSDLRGLLGMNDADGTRVPAGPRDVQLHVRIGAEGVAAERLHALSQGSRGSAPVTAALEAALPVALVVEVVA
jgi:uncharacterized OsmC-like protein